MNETAMRGEREIEKVVQDGERNLRTAELIQNWCEHVRIRRGGGIGLVEQMTGFPIGHASLDCDFVDGSSGFMTYDWRDAAVDFYDRHCAQCPHRKPVGFPNLMQLVQQRDAQSAARARTNAEHEAARIQAFEARRVARAELKSRLPTLSATLVDQIAEIDESRTSDASTAFVKTAAVAPDTFVPEVIDHLFELLSNGETWIAVAALSALSKLNVDRARLVSAALACLARHDARDVAAAIVAANPELAPPDLIVDALPALIQLANPARSSFQTHYILEPDPLISVYRAHPDITAKALQASLRSRRVYSVGAAARGITALAPIAPELLARFARDLTALLARTEWLIDEEVDERDDKLDEVRDALRLAWQSDPAQADTLFLDYFESANDMGQVRLVNVLRSVVSAPGRHDSAEGAAQVVALQRLVQLATTATTHDVLKEVAHAFSGRPYGLTLAVLAQMETMLGAAAVMDGKLDEFEEAPLIDGGQTAAFDRLNKEQQIRGLRSSLIRWVSGAIAGNEEAVPRYLAFIESLPPVREQLKADLIESLGRLITSPQILSEALPVLYGSMLGASVRLRGAAAEALAGLSRNRGEDLPSLVFEALVVMTQDPYVYVHRAAFKALASLPVPDHVLPDASRAVQGLMLVYGVDESLGASGERFFVEVAVGYARRFASSATLSGQLGQYMVERLVKADPSTVSSELRQITWALAETRGIGTLILNVLADREERSLDLERVIDCIEHLPDERLLEVRDQLVDTGLRLAGQGADPSPVVEPLLRIGRWDEAISVMKAALSQALDVPRERRRRLHLESVVCALQLEANVLAGNPDSPPGFLDRFDAVLEQLQKQEDHAIPFDPSKLFGPH